MDDLPVVIAAFLPTVGVVVVLTIAFLRRKKHRVSMILNPYTLALDPDRLAAQVQPAPVRDDGPDPEPPPTGR